MKTLFFAILCTSSMLFAAPGDVEKEFRQNETQEIAAFEPVSLSSQSISPEEMKLPTPALEPRRKSPFLAVGLSTLFPGLGHAYLGDSKTAGEIMGSAGLGVGVVSFSNPDKPLFGTGLVTLQNTWSYGIYAAYRDVRLFNGNAGYAYKMPTDSFADLSYAPFRWRVLKKPEVWGGLLGALGLAAGVSYLIHRNDAHVQLALSSAGKLSPLLAFPVGLGEESLFRGYLQSYLSERLTPWGGILISSLTFGAVHIPNAMVLEPEHRKGYYTFTLPLITAFGVYFGWLTYKNHSLQESVAVHSWYDFAIFAASSFATQSACTGRPGFALAVPF